MNWSKQGKKMFDTLSELKDIDRDGIARARSLPRLTGERVLVIEDDVDNRNVLAAVLQQCGADGDQDGALGLGLHDAERRKLGLGAGLRRPTGGLAATSGVTPTSRCGLASRCLSLGLGLGSHSYSLSFPDWEGSGDSYYF